MYKDKSETIRAARLCTVHKYASDCKRCPYVKTGDGNDNPYCQRDLIRDLYLMIEAREHFPFLNTTLETTVPRILELAEVQDLADSFFEVFVWVELYSPQENRMCLCYCKINRASYEGAFALTEDSGTSWIREEGYYNTGAGKWRCWTERPTFEDRMKADRETVKLMPCPFCGADAAKISTAMQLEECAMAESEECPARKDADAAKCGYKTVVCDVNKGGCGAASGFWPTEEEAVRKWNQRAGEKEEEDGKAGI